VSSFVPHLFSPPALAYHGRVAHNVSQRRREELDREQRRRELAAFLVPGWELDATGRKIVEIKTVLGFYQRGQGLLLRCSRVDCRRRVEVDFRAAVEAGLGDKPISVLIDALRCRHWRGCELGESSQVYPHGVPLVGFLDQPDVLVAIACRRCTARVLLRPRAMILKLKAAGRGDGSTGIKQLGELVRGPCRQCGARRFESEVVWPRHPSSC
jgi:DNA-directed RNA polymerase subunit RPC12/RpoP